MLLKCQISDWVHFQPIELEINIPLNFQVVLSTKIVGAVLNGLRRTPFVEGRRLIRDPGLPARRTTAVVYVFSVFLCSTNMPYPEGHHNDVTDDNYSVVL